jgi:polyisoprenyl-phosphate glycosyltransferase
MCATPYEPCASADPGEVATCPTASLLPDRRRERSSRAGERETEETATQYSLIIPVYNNEGSVDRVIAAVQHLNERLEGLLEVIFVIDGSPDRCYERLRSRLAEGTVSGQIVRLSRNFGSFAAIRMGLSVGRGPYFAVMAADLQEPPELIETFFRSLSGEPVDVVLGVRTDRDDPALSKASAKLFWSIYRRLVQRDMPEGGVDCFGCNRQVRDALMILDESNSSLVGQLVWLGFRRKHVAYRRLPRREGKSGWTFRRKLHYMLDSIFSFTDLPLILLTVVGFLGLLCSATVGAVVFTAWCLGAITVPGYTPILLVIVGATSGQLLGLGVIGAYARRAYENTKHRPLFVPMSRECFSAGQSASGEP